MYQNLRTEHTQLVQGLYSDIVQAGDDKMFSPHPFTPDYAQLLCNNWRTRKDLYIISLSGPEIFSYGMLRGWDEGFEIPSLGIYIPKMHRGKGLGRKFMRFLHYVADARGAK